MGRYGWLRWGVGLLLLAADSGWAEAGAGGARTFGERWREAVAAFEQGAFAQARESFERLEADFGMEPEYRADAVQRLLLPLHALSLLRSGEGAAARPLLEAWLERFPERSDRAALVLHCLGESCAAAGQGEAARAAWGRFLAEYPDAPEAAGVRMRTAESWLAEGRTTDALGALDELLGARAAHGLQAEARLLGAEVALKDGRLDRATGYLLGFRWEAVLPPESVRLARGALAAGDALLRQRRFEEAVRVLRLVPSYDELLRMQAQAIRAEERRLARRGRLTGTRDTTPGGGDAGTRRLKEMLRAQARLVESGDYAPGHLLRYGRALSGAGWHFEAWTVFASLAEDAELEAMMRAEAHFRWILEAQALRRWGTARELAERFADRYPREEKAPLVRFLLAQSLQELGRHGEAEALLSELLENHPRHPLGSRWLFTRGFNRLLQDKHGAARRDFARFGERFPGDALLSQARLWHALAWFFEKRYAAAREELEILLATTPPDHHLVPEMAFRRAAVLYAERDHATALEQLESFFSAFPEHPRVPAARVLEGDARMALGRLEAAVQSYQAVPEEVEALRVYAVFQIGKALRARGDYTALAAHFVAYVEQAEGGAPARAAEALSRAGWALEQEGRLAEAVPLYRRAFARWGDDPSQTGMEELLGGLARLYGRLGAEAETTSPAPGEGFGAWLEAESAKAFREGRFTAFARLRGFEAGRLERAGASGDARSAWSRIGEAVPAEALDARGLAGVGAAWQSAARPGAEALFERLLERFPDSPERMAAWLGLGRAAFQRKAYAAAVQWLAPASETLHHPAAPAAVLLHAECLLALKRGNEIPALLDPVLRLRSARGRTHAHALVLLGKAAEQAGDGDRAIAYYQRVYTLYRAYGEWVLPAYLRSAELFAARGDRAAAQRTWEELLRQPALDDPALRERVRRELERLGADAAPAGVSSEGGPEA